MLKKLLLLGLVLVMSVPSFAQNTRPEQAQKILNAAITQAKSSDKNVFVIFHASWCIWCKRLEKAITSDELKKIFDDNYVMARVDVLERGEKESSIENPGGRAIMKKLGGERSGLPFYLFLDAKGKKIIDSNQMDNNSNIGYPAAETEIAAFLKMIKKSAKHLTDKNAGVIAKYLKENAPKANG